MLTELSGVNRERRQPASVALIEVDS